MNALDVTLRAILPDDEGELVWSRDRTDPNHVGFISDFGSVPAFRESVTNLEGADGAVVGPSYRGARTTVWDFDVVEYLPAERSRLLWQVQALAGRYRNRDITLEWDDPSVGPVRTVGRIYKPFQPTHKTPGPLKSGQLQLVSPKHYLEAGGDSFVREWSAAGTENGFRVLNTGNAYAYPQFWIHGCGGVAIDSGDQQIYLDYTVTGANFVYVDCAPGLFTRRALLNGNPAAGNIEGALTANYPDFFQLAPGTTDLAIAVTNPGPNFKIRCEHRSAFDS